MPTCWRHRQNASCDGPIVRRIVTGVRHVASGVGPVTTRSSSHPEWTSVGLTVFNKTGHDLAVLNYVLLILGFFTGVTTVIAVALAYGRRRGASGYVRSHLDWQIRIVWRGALALLTVALLHALVVGLGVVTFGIGLVFLVIPWALGLVWLVWTIWAIVRGMNRLRRRLPIS